MTGPGSDRGDGDDGARGGPRDGGGARDGSGGGAAARVAVIAGASPGLGSALAESLLANGWTVVALGRATAIRAVADAVPGVRGIACELTDAADVDRAFAVLEAASGPASLVVYNAHRIELGPVNETSPEAFETAWRACCFGAFVVARRALPAMRARGRGTLVFSGATGSLRGGPRSSAFAAAKFALRGLAQSLARELAPAGIHVVHVILDGLIWSAQTRARFASATEATSMSPRAVAAAYLAVIGQEAGAWTHELDLRPAAERP